MGLFQSTEIADCWEDLGKSKVRNDIMTKHVQIEREKFIKASAHLTKTNNKVFENVIQSVKAMGTIIGIPMHILMDSRPIDSAGFQQRGLFKGTDSLLEVSIRRDGWNVAIGSFAIVEIPWTKAEVAECTQRNVVPRSWSPPAPFAMTDDEKEGGMVWLAENVECRLGERRFGIIDGNNRIHALSEILKTNPHFLDRVSLNAIVLQVYLYDSLSVQVAGMKMNLSSHTQIKDNQGDKILQYQAMLRFYADVTKQDLYSPKFNLSSTVSQIISKSEIFNDLMPNETVTGTSSRNHTKQRSEKEQAKSKKDKLAAAIRLAIMVPPEFAHVIQSKLAGDDGNGGGVSAGTSLAFHSHTVKMSCLFWKKSDFPKDCGFEDRDYHGFLLYRAKQMEWALDYKHSSKSTKTDKDKQMLKDWMGYSDRTLQLAYCIWKRVPVMVDQCKCYFKELVEKYKDEPDILKLVPYPSDADYDPLANHGEIETGQWPEDSDVIKNLRKLESGAYDAFLFRNLSVEQEQVVDGLVKSKRAKWLVWPLPTEFDGNNYPMPLKMAFHVLHSSISQVVDLQKQKATNAQLKQKQVERAKHAQVRQAQILKVKLASAAKEKAILAAAAAKRQSKADRTAAAAAAASTPADDAKVPDDAAAAADDDDAAAAADDDDLEVVDLTVPLTNSETTAIEAQLDDDYQAELADIALSDSSADDEDILRFGVITSEEIAIMTEAAKIEGKGRDKSKEKLKTRRTNGMFFNPGHEHSDLVETNYEQRVGVCTEDLTNLFNPTSTFMTDDDVVDLFYGDTPYGIYKGNSTDKLFSESLVGTICAGMLKKSSENGVVLIGCGTVEEASRWRAALGSAGFHVEDQARVVVDNPKHMAQKRQYSTAKWHGVVNNCHFLIVGYKDRKQFKYGNMYGAMKTVPISAVYQQTSAFTGVPTMSAQNKLVDEKGRVIRFCEKHIAYMCELLSIFLPKRNKVVMDICCGTGPMGLAAIKMNFSKVILNDRDVSCMKYTVARVKAYIAQLLVTDRLGECSGDKTSKNPRTDHMDDYIPLKEWTKRPLLDDNVVVIARTNNPNISNMEVYCEDNGIFVATSKLEGCEGQDGLWTNRPVETGFELAMWGRFRRSVCMQNGKIVTVKVCHTPDQSTRQLYLRVDDDCPAGKANDPNFCERDQLPAGSKVPFHCQIQEWPNRCWWDPAKLSLVFTTAIPEASSEEPVEILANYLLCENNADGTATKPTMRTTAWHTREKKPKKQAVQPAPGNILPEAKQAKATGDQMRRKGKKPKKRRKAEDTDTPSTRPPSKRRKVTVDLVGEGGSDDNDNGLVSDDGGDDEGDNGGDNDDEKDEDYVDDKA